MALSERETLENLANIITSSKTRVIFYNCSSRLTDFKFNAIAVVSSCDSVTHFELITLERLRESKEIQMLIKNNEFATFLLDIPTSS